MCRDVKLVVNKAYHNKRVDLFLKDRFPDVSRKEIRCAFLERAVLVNGRESRKGATLSEGDIVQVRALSSKKDIRYLPNALSGPKIVFKDEYVAAIYKPPFMHTLPAMPGEKDTLANYAVHMFPGSSGKDCQSQPPFLSRLDFLTSGMVLMARGQETYQELRAMEAKGEILKGYALIVSGVLREEMIVPNRIITTGKGKVRVDRGCHSHDERYHTKFIPEEVFGEYSLLRAEIRKGRMHQIRAHASFAGFPIVGDSKYGGEIVPPMKELPVRPMLHSAVVEFTHTVSGLRIKIICPYPEDLYRLLDHLQGSSNISRS